MGIFNILSASLTSTITKTKQNKSSISQNNRQIHTFENHYLSIMSLAPVSILDKDSLLQGTETCSRSLKQKGRFILKVWINVVRSYGDCHWNQGFCMKPDSFFQYPSGKIFFFRPLFISLVCFAFHNFNLALLFHLAPHSSLIPYLSVSLIKFKK